MAKKRQSNLTKSSGGAAQDRLESLNARVRGKGDSPDLIRRSMKAQIEAKAKRRRARQTPGASARLGVK